MFWGQYKSEILDVGDLFDKILFAVAPFFIVLTVLKPTDDY